MPAPTVDSKAHFPCRLEEPTKAEMPMSWGENVPPAVPSSAAPWKNLSLFARRWSSRRQAVPCSARGAQGAASCWRRRSVCRAGSSTSVRRRRRSSRNAPQRSLVSGWCRERGHIGIRSRRDVAGRDLGERWRLGGGGGRVYRQNRRQGRHIERRLGDDRCDLIAGEIAGQPGDGAQPRGTVGRCRDVADDGCGIVRAKRHRDSISVERHDECPFGRVSAPFHRGDRLSTQLGADHPADLRRVGVERGRGLHHDQQRPLGGVHRLSGKHHEDPHPGQARPLQSCVHAHMSPQREVSFNLKERPLWGR